jgi:hypothetical protein
MNKAALQQSITVTATLVSEWGEDYSGMVQKLNMTSSASIHRMKALSNLQVGSVLRLNAHQVYYRPL